MMKMEKSKQNDKEPLLLTMLIKIKLKTLVPNCVPKLKGILSLLVPVFLDCELYKCFSGFCFSPSLLGGTGCLEWAGVGYFLTLGQFDSDINR